MALTSGPNLGLLINGAAGEQHYAEMMRFFRGVDLLVQARVKSASIIAQPGSPADGDAYLVPTGATGGWSGQVGKIARYSSVVPGWEYITPKKGWQVTVEDVGSFGMTYRYNGTAWGKLYTLPTYADQAAAASGGLVAGELFMKADGTVMVKT